MATYINKTMIDGVEELPRLTEEEFLAIPVAERPKIWVKRNATETDRGITAEDVQYSSTQNVKEKIDSFATVATSGNYNDLSNKPNVFEYMTAPNSSDGRYYTRTFTHIATERFPIIILRNSQNTTSVPSDRIVYGQVNNTGGGNSMGFNSTTVTYTPSTKTITIDCGQNAWAMPYILAPKGALS